MGQLAPRYQMLKRYRASALWSQMATAGVPEFQSPHICESPIKGFAVHAFEVAARIRGEEKMGYNTIPEWDQDADFTADEERKYTTSDELYGGIALEGESVGRRARNLGHEYDSDRRREPEPTQSLDEFLDEISAPHRRYLKRNPQKDTLDP